MKTMILGLCAAAALLALPATALANAPAPWWPCDGLNEGDECGDGIYYDGMCELQQECTDDTGTDVNECLICNGTGPGPDLELFTPTDDTGGTTSDDTGGTTSDDTGGTPPGDAGSTTGGGDAGTQATGGGGGSSGGCSAVHVTTSTGILLLLIMTLAALSWGRRRDPR